MIHVLEPSRNAHVDLCHALMLALDDGAYRGRIDYQRISGLMQMAATHDCNVVRCMLEKVLEMTR